MDIDPYIKYIIVAVVFIGLIFMLWLLSVMTKPGATQLNVIPTDSSVELSRTDVKIKPSTTSNKSV